MPRAEQSAGTRIVNFFRGAELPQAEFVLGLCKDAVQERRQRSAEAKARALKSGAAKGGKPAALATAHDAPPKGKAKARKKTKARKPKSPALPVGPTQTDAEAAAAAAAEAATP